MKTMTQEYERIKIEVSFADGLIRTGFDWGEWIDLEPTGVSSVDERSYI